MDSVSPSDNSGSSVLSSLGRVQTPTLAIICKRYTENMNFVSVPYRQLQIGLAKDGKAITALSKEKIDSKTDANNIYASQQLFREAVISKVERKEVMQEPPLLYDLTTLQKEANSKHGFSADKTLSLAQKLYEQHKLITYPRTGSRYIPGDVFQEAGELIENLKSY
ncbi:DNA topoisomerase 3, partial [termite gut metagenome]